MNQSYPDELAQLDQAVQKAEGLLAELVQQQADLDRNPPRTPPADLVAGRSALQDMIASARRTVLALQDARRVANDAPPDNA